MIKHFRVETIVKKSENPFILTLNNTNHLIGDYARALERYIQKGMNVKAEGNTRGDDILIERIDFTDGVQIGVQINKYA